MTTHSRTRRFAAVIAAASVTIALAACSTGATGGGASAAGAAGAAEQNGLTLAEVQEAGELVIGTEGTYRPFTFREGGSGDLTGYDVEVVTAVAEKLGVKPVFKETQWDAIFAGLTAGRFDVIANQVSITDERMKDFDFSEPYTISPGVLIVAADNTEITGFDDLAGATTAQSLTSNWYTVAEDAGAEVQQVEGWAQAVELVRQGRVDATVNDELTYLDFENTEGDTGLRIVDQTDDPSRNALAFRKGSTDLVDAVDAALAELRADGTLAEISEKYFGEDVSQ